MTIFPKMEFLESKRILTRDSDLSDAEFVLRLHNEPSFIRGYKKSEMRTLAEAEEFIRAAQDEAYKKLILVLKETGERIGFLVYTTRREFLTTEFSIAFLPEFQACGYFVEIFRAFCRYAADPLGFETICLKNKTCSPKISERMLGIKFQTIIDTPDGDEWNFYTLDLKH